MRTELKFSVPNAGLQLKHTVQCSQAYITSGLHCVCIQEIQDYVPKAPMSQVMHGHG